MNHIAQFSMAELTNIDYLSSVGVIIFPVSLPTSHHGFTPLLCYFLDYTLDVPIDQEWVSHLEIKLTVVSLW